MNQRTTRSVSIPVADDWDVLVVGGGPAGCTAAASAARAGARTLLIEATGCLGGMGTSGLVPAWCPFSDGERIIYRGLAEAVFRESMKGVPHIASDRLDWVPINPEQLKVVYDDLLNRHGVRVLFATFMAGVVAENGVVDAVIVANKAGLRAYRASVFVDCTGDGDLAAWAGAECEKGDPHGGPLQAATHCFTLANVDVYAYRHGRQFFHTHPTSPIKAMIADPKYPLITDPHSCNTLQGPGCVGFNTGHVTDVDNTDPESLSRALMIGRKTVRQFHDALAEYLPESFAASHLVNTGALLGVRETRRVVGDYRLTLEDYVARRSFADEICRNAYCLDLHLTPKTKARLRTDARDDAEFSCHYGHGESHGIPYRCLVPKDLTNVLVAGRCISTDRLVNGSVRVMPVCLATGEAAGEAAAMAADDAGNAHRVDTDTLRNRLKAHGAYLPEP